MQLIWYEVQSIHKFVRFGGFNRNMLTYSPTHVAWRETAFSRVPPRYEIQKRKNVHGVWSGALAHAMIFLALPMKPTQTCHWKAQSANIPIPSSGPSPAIPAWSFKQPLTVRRSDRCGSENRAPPKFSLMFSLETALFGDVANFQTPPCGFLESGSGGPLFC